MNTTHSIKSSDDIYENISDAEYRMFGLLDKTPTLSQRDLSGMLGFSLGKVNYCFKALIDKGLTKGDNFIRNPKKSMYTYLLTPKGIKSKAVLTAQFLDRKTAQYEILGKEIEDLKNRRVEK